MKEPLTHLEHITPEDGEPKTREYKLKSGGIWTFDITREACEPFGFYPGERVETPSGPATVIGVNNGSLWFHCDEDKGASYWIGYEELLEERKFRLISGDEDISAPDVSSVAKENEDEEPEQEHDENFAGDNKQKQELFPGITEDEHSVSYLGVRLLKAENTSGPFVPKRETYGDYINEKYSLELQKKIAISFLQGDPMLIEGGTSIGKTTTVKKMCAELGWEVHYVNVKGDVDSDDFMGRYASNIEKKNAYDPEFVFNDGKVTSGLRQEEGKIKVIILDEYNAAKPNVAIRIHEILDALEHDTDVVLSEDASESLPTSKKKTKIIALINPPGRGFLAREPLDTAQIRRWVYDKEPTDLPDETFSYSTDALFGLSSGDELQPREAFLTHPTEGISTEQLAEIPGMSEVLSKYQEFHKAAKKLLKERKLAADQPQPFTFDDRMEPRRVRDFVARFFTGDVNAVFQEALRYYYVNKLEKPDDRATLNELIATVCYIPPKAPSKRKSLDGDKTEKNSAAKPVSVPDSGTVKEALKSSEEPETRQYIERGGEDVGTFVISREACEPFGFYPGERVITSESGRLATVIGVKDDNLWFHRDGDDGASFWSGNKKEDFESRGFCVITDEEEKEKKPKSKETLVGRDPEEFLNEALDWLRKTKNASAKSDWVWRISSDGQWVNMRMTHLPPDIDKNEEISFFFDEDGRGLDDLLKKLKGKKILSVDNGGSWYLEVLD
jgi:MoxR-like ATPase